MRVNSSAVSKARYWSRTKSLDVVYTGKEPYRYFRVPREEVEAMLQAESIGKFVNKVIKKHRYRKLSPTELN